MKRVYRESNDGANDNIDELRHTDRENEWKPDLNNLETRMGEVENRISSRLDVMESKMDQLLTTPLVEEHPTEEVEVSDAGEVGLEKHHPTKWKPMIF